MYLQHVDKKVPRFWRPMWAHIGIMYSGHQFEGYMDILMGTARASNPVVLQHYPGIFHERALLYFFDKGEPYYHPFRKKWMDICNTT